MAPSRLPPRGTGPSNGVRPGQTPQALTPADGRSSQRDTNRRTLVPKGNPRGREAPGSPQGAPEEVPLGPPGAARPPRGCQVGTSEPVAPRGRRVRQTNPQLGLAASRSANNSLNSRRTHAPNSSAT